MALANADDSGPLSLPELKVRKVLSYFTEYTVPRP